MSKDKSVIPKGDYCYGINGEVCQYWSIDESKPAQDNGYCKYLEQGDWESEGISLIWDQVKECGENLWEE